MQELRRVGPEQAANALGIGSDEYRYSLRFNVLEPPAEAALALGKCHLAIGV